MKLIALQSGSSGNCAYVEADGVRLLFDAGISGSKAERRLAGHGREIRDVDALVISHDHSDHTSGMGVFQRKFGLPIHITKPTLATTQARHAVGKLNDVRHYSAGSSLRFGTVTVETIPTPHDGVDGVGFVVDDGRHRLGILTDLGHVFAGLDAVIETLDALLIESNYDETMLAESFYPATLKKRIRGDGGHLSNAEAAELIDSSMGSRLQWVCLGHLSAENNTPEEALREHQERLSSRVSLFLAGRDAATDVLEL